MFHLSLGDGIRRSRHGRTYLVPAQGPGAGDEEGLRILGEEDFPGHSNRIAEDRNEIRRDMGHRGMRIGVENLIRGMSIRAVRLEVGVSTSSVTSMGPGMLQSNSDCARAVIYRSTYTRSLGEGVARRLGQNYEDRCRD